MWSASAFSCVRGVRASVWLLSVYFPSFCMCFSFTFLDFIVRVHRVSFNMYHLLTHDPTLGIAVFNGECFNCLIQTEAERRRREAGVKQSMEIRLRSCMWVCMVFGIISRTKACSATNEVSKCRSPERSLLRHTIIGVRHLTSARRAKMPK